MAVLLLSGGCGCGEEVEEEETWLTPDAMQMAEEWLDEPSEAPYRNEEAEEVVADVVEEVKEKGGKAGHEIWRVAAYLIVLVLSIVLSLVFILPAHMEGWGFALVALLLTNLLHTWVGFWPILILCVILGLTAWLWQQAKWVVWFIGLGLITIAGFFV